MSRTFTKGESAFWYSDIEEGPKKWIPVTIRTPYTTHEISVMTEDQREWMAKQGEVVRWQDLQRGDKVKYHHPTIEARYRQESSFIAYYPSRNRNGETVDTSEFAYYTTEVDGKEASDKWNLKYLRPHDLFVSGYPKIVSKKSVEEKQEKKADGYEPKVGDWVEQTDKSLRAPHEGGIVDVRDDSVVVIDSDGERRLWGKAWVKLKQRLHQEEAPKPEYIPPPADFHDIKVGDWVRFRGSSSGGRVEHIHGSGTRVMVKLPSGSTLHWDKASIEKVDSGPIEYQPAPPERSFMQYDIVREKFTPNFYVVMDKERKGSTSIYKCSTETGILKELPEHSLVSEYDPSPWRPHQGIIEYQKRLKAGAQSSAAAGDIHDAMSKSWLTQYEEAMRAGLKVHERLEDQQMKAMRLAQRYGYDPGPDRLEPFRRRGQYPLTPQQAHKQSKMYYALDPHAKEAIAQSTTDDGVQILKTPSVGTLITLEDDITLL